VSEWWTYTLRDFLLFSPRVYWRMFELHNEAFWPLHIFAVLLGVAILVFIIYPRPWSGQAVAAILALAWLWVAWSFLWARYATINWAATYAAAAFAIEALLLFGVGGVWGGLTSPARLRVRSMIGLALFLFALLCYPAIAVLSGRSLQAAEVFGIAPDPTAVATLGILALGHRGKATLILLAIPFAWCIASWATLYAMNSSEAWVPLIAPGLAVASLFWGSKQTSAECRHDEGNLR
jgi:hypothetical protein